MPRNTLIIVGPGGVGKSPLDDLLRDEVIRVDPYRLRERGPRNRGDVLYAPPKLRKDLHAALAALGKQPQTVKCDQEKIEWFPDAKVLLFTVRGEWQCLFLGALEGDIAKAELYAPVLLSILGLADVQTLFGQTSTIVLNPMSDSITEMVGWTDLEKKTKQNCLKRGDSLESAKERAGSVAVEAPAWRDLIQKNGAIEYVAWPFPEYRYQREVRQELRIGARRVLLEGHPELEVFLKSDDGIRRMYAHS